MWSPQPDDDQMPYSPPSSAFTAADVPRIGRPTSGDSSRSTMLNFSTERGPGAHKPLRGLPRRAKPGPAPVVTDDATPRSMPAVRKAKFGFGDDDSSESNSGSPKESPSAEHPRGLSIDTAVDAAVPFPLLSPDPPPAPKGLELFADPPITRSLSSSMIPPSPIPALLSPRLLPHSAQKSLQLNGSGHARSASMADACLDSSRISPSASGTATPIIRKSNGQPLKPSLKSSLSSPNISSMNEPRRVAKSAPTTPRVHFKELGLESVVLFDKGARPVAVSGEYNGADDTETETETETNKAYPFPPLSPPPALVRLAPTTSQPTFQPPPHSHVHLQYLSLPPVRPPRLHGTVLVRNVAFGKTVVVRYTTDNWETASEINASYSSSLPPGIIPGSMDAAWDKFTFTIKLDDIERSLPDRTLFCVVRYDAHGVGEWWDNNHGQNYRVEFERPDSNGLGLDPNAPKACTTGDQSSAPRPFNPLTYQASNSLAPPAPTTKPRSYSTSVVTPPAPIKAAPTPPAGSIPHALGLRLKNYVSPTANIPKAPPLAKPQERKQQEHHDANSFSPPSSPEHVKRQVDLPDNDLGADFHPGPREFSSISTPLKMPVTITPPDSAHNSPCSSPPMKRQPLLPPSALPLDNGLLSPTSSPSNSMLITSPSSPSQNDAGQAGKPRKDEGASDTSPVSLEGSLLDQSYPELLKRFCFNHSSPGGTPPYGSSPGPLGALGMTNGYLVGSPKTSPRGGSPAGSGTSSPATGSKSGIPRGGSYVLGTPGAGPVFIK